MTEPVGSAPPPPTPAPAPAPPAANVDRDATPAPAEPTDTPAPDPGASPAGEPVEPAPVFAAPRRPTDEPEDPPAPPPPPTGRNWSEDLDEIPIAPAPPIDPTHDPLDPSHFDSDPAHQAFLDRTKGDLDARMADAAVLASATVSPMSVQDAFQRLFTDGTPTNEGAIPFELGEKGDDPERTAYDCSGLLTAAYRAAGMQIDGEPIDPHMVGAEDLFRRMDPAEIPASALDATGHLSRDAALQLEADGVLKPGMALFFQGSDGTPTSPGHVSMYVGDGYMAEGAGSSLGLRRSPVDTWGHFMGAGAPPQAWVE